MGLFDFLTKKNNPNNNTKYRIVEKKEKIYEPAQEVVVYKLENVKDNEPETCVVLKHSAIAAEFEQARINNRFVELSPELFNYVIIPYDENNVISIFYHKDVRR